MLPPVFVPFTHTHTLLGAGAPLIPLVSRYCLEIQTGTLKYCTVSMTRTLRIKFAIGVDYYIMKRVIVGIMFI